MTIIAIEVSKIKDLDLLASAFNEIEKRHRKATVILDPWNFDDFTKRFAIVELHDGILCFRTNHEEESYILYDPDQIEALPAFIDMYLITQQENI